ncbi:MAG TPA: hypothetical protein VM099_12165 [Gemmatimonadaceae bacterium]|nr:hypothetical protein [Gemmatimonadaceae bacterium]
MKRATLVGIAVFLSSCASQPKPVAPLNPGAEFAVAIEAARIKVDAGDYPTADRILSEYSLKHQGTPEAREVAFWRAMYLVDPANRTASIAQGIRALDIYLATDGAIWYRPQAEVLRRTALVIQQVRQAQMPKQVNGRDTVFISREEEVAALRDQLAKANAELDRIKKRLANPGR